METIAGMERMAVQQTVDVGGSMVSLEEDGRRYHRIYIRIKISDMCRATGSSSLANKTKGNETRIPLDIPPLQYAHPRAINTRPFCYAL